MVKIILISMIKNEEKIIERCINDALSILDGICVTDTGSTDNTVSKVHQIFENLKIPGQLYNDTFKDFGHNRSNSFINAVDFCNNQGWDLNETYGLLLDADMQLVVKNFDKSMLKSNGYKIIQDTTCLEYYNTRFIKMSVNWKCVGVTHEYWDGSYSDNFGKDIIYINDIGDGGCKSDKIERDIRLLENGLKENPNNDRYHFYLAQSFKDCGRFDDAINFYKKRIALGGWVEEVWYSYYMISKCYLLKNNPEKFELWSLRAFNFFNTRAEPIYSLVKYFRETSQHFKAYHYYLIGKRLNFPQNDLLFVEKDVYNHLFDYENTILQYYIYPNERLNGLKLIVQYLNKYNNLDNNVFENMDFYLNRLIDDGTYNDLNIAPCGDFIPSSISLLKLNNNILANVRFVNYRIQPNGTYLMSRNGILDGNEKVRTRNAFMYLNNKMEKNSNLIFMPDTLDDLPNKDTHIIGLEDIRLYKNGDKIMYTATNSNHSYNDKIRILNGIYDIKQNKFTNNKSLIPPSETYCEKNWIGFEDKFIYKWHPLQIGILIDNKLEILITKDTPNFFKHYRGSSNLFEYNNQYWIITHGIKNITPRKYFHQMVVLDKEFNLVKYSVPFYFDKLQIEYCIGLMIINESIYSTVSRNDSNPIIVKTKLKNFDKYFI